MSEDLRVGDSQGWKGRRKTKDHQSPIVPRLSAKCRVGLVQGEKFSRNIHPEMLRRCGLYLDMASVNLSFSLLKSEDFVSLTICEQVEINMSDRC